MSTTFLQATNEILVESNEVKLTSSNFAGAVGVQEYVKNKVNAAYMEICAAEEEWPWLSAAAANTNEPYQGNVYIETVAGQRWYLLKTGSTGLATDYAKIDWDTFYLTEHQATGASSPYDHKVLQYTAFDHWVQKYSKSENQDVSGDQNYGLPERVVRSQDGRYFGLSPIPDGVYRVYFNAWVQPTALSAHGDTILIPDMFMPVLYDKVRYYMQLFKKDYQEATLAERAYEKGLKNMRRKLIGKQSDYMRDDRVTR